MFHQLPENPGLNASLSLPTFGIRTNINCENPISVDLSTTNSTNYTITATTAAGCVSFVTFNPASADQQYGSSSVNAVSCGLDPTLQQQFLPVMFWYFHLQDNTNAPQAKAVICAPTIDLFNVQAVVDLSNGSLTSVTILSGYAPPNNVTGGDLAGKAFNGYVLFHARLYSRSSLHAKLISVLIVSLYNNLPRTPSSQLVPRLLDLAFQVPFSDSRNKQDCKRSSTRMMRS